MICLRINEIKKNQVNVNLNSDELVALMNIMYFYERYYNTDPDNHGMTPLFHELSAEITEAASLCQYGHLDNHALGRIIKHKAQANPGSWEGVVTDLAGFYPKIADLIIAEAEKEGD